MASITHTQQSVIANDPASDVSANAWNAEHSVTLNAADVGAEASGTAASAVAAHEADTTAVHGIADTSTLYRAGGTDVAITDGGTGSSTASGARTNLGVAYGASGDLAASAEGDTAAAGAAGKVADAGHRHAREAFATPTLALGSAAAAGSAATPIRSDSTIAAFDATVPATQAFGDAAAVGSAAKAARRDHTHGMPANPTVGLVNDLIFVIDGGGAVLTTGVKGDLVVDFACTITKWTLLADQSGSVVVNVWKDAYANYPPTVADKVTASAPPTITTALKGQSSTLTGWTTAIAAGDTLRFNCDSVTTIQRVTLALTVART